MFWTDTEAARYLEENGLPYNPQPHVVKKMTAAANLLNGLTVLDVGCGEGHLYHFIKDKAEKYIGLDASPDMLKTATYYAPEASWRLGDVYNLEDVDRCDTVFSISLLIHLENQSEAIRQLWSRALKRLVFLIPIQKEEKIINVRPGLIYHQTTFDGVKKIVESLEEVKRYTITPLSDLKPRIKLHLGLLRPDVRLHYFVVVDRIQAH